MMITIFYRLEWVGGNVFFLFVCLFLEAMLMIIKCGYELKFVKCLPCIKY